ncbi:xanthine dehydrogenase accessory factor [Pseudomonas extremaustralis]|uniref:hypothetical protein n=1 Tax=Pseudomonas extremaustralis TaxID=359110 RepID=UPI00099BDE3D|nr:hypothetical protein [Pseudomonas extremaustralis]SKA80230.1 xanthine dehydrogenase accessory factor [Pseudomonas extremaustralis]
MLVVSGDVAHCGSLPGGCIEEGFLQRLAIGGYAEPLALMFYDACSDAPRVQLPCSGVMEVLVEHEDAGGHP